MFLLIFETGEVKKTDSISDEDYMASDDGYIQIIEISNTSSPKEYINGEWEEVVSA